MMKPTPWSWMVAGMLLVVAAGCNTTSVRTASREQIVQESVPIPESLLLDVGVDLFNPGVTSGEEEGDGIYPSIREAEARFMPFKLMETLQESGNWGMVRVIPGKQSEMDVWVDGEILLSDGASLELQITVSDSSGMTWFTRKYRDIASKYNYDTTLAARTEPFQGLYNHVANDMLEFYLQLPPDRITGLRTITGLKFARRFSPESFTDHLVTAEDGTIHVVRLPPPDDPVLQRVNSIRERDYMFVDTLQDYYASFVRQMEIPYLEWRRAYYEENDNLRKVRSQAFWRTLGGIAAVGLGILAQGSDSRVTRAAGQVGIGGGIAAVYSGMNKREEVKYHEESLAQISDSLAGEMEPHTLELRDRTVTLTGTVNEQYSQWREILKEIYQAETGRTDPP